MKGEASSVAPSVLGGLQCGGSGDPSDVAMPASLLAPQFLQLNSIFPPSLGCHKDQSETTMWKEACHTCKKSGERILGLTSRGCVLGKTQMLALSLSKQWGICRCQHAEGQRARQGSRVGSSTLVGPDENSGPACPCGTHTRPLPLSQMMMQYLYYGGTEAMDIPTADILEVRIWLPPCWGEEQGARMPAPQLPVSPSHSLPMTFQLEASSRPQPCSSQKGSTWAEEERRTHFPAGRPFSLGDGKGRSGRLGNCAPTQSSLLGLPRD